MKCNRCKALLTKRNIGRNDSTCGECEVKERNIGILTGEY